MASSQITTQSLFHGKTTLSENKYVIKNLWYYYEWKGKKCGCWIKNHTAQN